MRKKISKQILFPAKLNQILNNSTLHRFISFGQDKISIEIHDIKSFQRNILAKYFRHRNFQSFSRQMNLYGFKKNRNSIIQIFTSKQLKNGKRIIDLQSRNQRKRQKQSKQSDQRKKPEIFIVQNEDINTKSYKKCSQVQNTLFEQMQNKAYSVQNPIITGIFNYIGNFPSQNMFYWLPSLEPQIGIQFPFLFNMSRTND